MLFIKLGYNDLTVLVIATIGNTLGSMSTYYIGYFGKSITKINNIISNLEKAKLYEKSIKKFGYVFAFLTFMPIIGDIFALALGLSKYNIIKTIIFITLGKALRYYIIIYITNASA